MAVRDTSLAKARGLGYAPRENLPLLEPPTRLREVREVVDRILVLEVLTAAAEGESCNDARDALEERGLLHACSASERAYLQMTATESEAPAEWFELNEGQWALGWAVSVIRDLDFTRCAGAALSIFLPDELTGLQAREHLRARCRLRPAAAIYEARDLAYCLYDCVERARLGGPPIPERGFDHVIIQRHRALAWLTYAGDWDDVVPYASHWPPQQGRKPLRSPRGKAGE